MARCAALTATGRKCKASAMVGSKYCRSHKGGYRARSKCRSKASSCSCSCSPHNVFKSVDAGSCRPKTPLGRPMRKLPGDMVIPTAREYVNRFPEAERKQKLEEYMNMSGCDLVKLAVHKDYKKKVPYAYV